MLCFYHHLVYCELSLSFSLISVTVYLISLLIVDTSQWFGSILRVTSSSLVTVWRILVDIEAEWSLYILGLNGLCMYGG